MALGRQRERQSDILVSWAELPRSPGHAFYDKLQTVLIASDFDRFVEMQCASEYHAAADRGGNAPGAPRAGFRLAFRDRGSRWRADRHHVRRNRRSTRRLRRQNPARPVRLKTRFL